MYTQVTRLDFHDAFDGKTNFSYEGLDALFEYLEEYEESADSKIELDVVALCCEYTEDSNENHLANYDLDSMEELEEHTIVIKIDDDTSIIQDF